MSRSEGDQTTVRTFQKPEIQGAAAEQNQRETGTLRSRSHQLPGAWRSRAAASSRHLTCPVVLGRTMPDSFAVHFLKVLRELLAFVLFSYTVLVGALLLAGWTTYFLVLK